MKNKVSQQMKIVAAIFLFFFVLENSFGQAPIQAPIINSVQPLTSYPGNAILITGSGFSSTSNQVWFDHIKGTILRATELSIEVTVPPQARLSNIEVINLTTGLSAKTVSKFVPFYNGSDFLPTEFADPVAGSTTFSTGTEESFDVCSCDLDGDGKPDLASTKNGSTSTNISILRNTSTPGNLSFTSTSATIGAPSINLACGDLNMDGKPDLIMVRGGVTRNQLFVLRNTSTSGSISFAAATSLFIDPLQSAFRVVIRDLNLDGKPELIVSNSNNIASANIIYIFSNQSSGGTLNINATPTKVIVNGASTTYGLDAQDMNGDSKPDLIISQFNASDIFILKNESSVGQLSFPNTTKIALTGNLNHLTTADFNMDGKLDVAVTSSANDNKAFVLLNQSSVSDFSFSTLPTLTGGDWPFGIDASDIDGDKDVDIVIGNINNNGALNEIVVYRSNGNNSSLAFTRESIQKGKRSRNLRVGDLDGDGKPDIAYTTVTSNSIDILRNKNCFVPAITNPLPTTICAGQTITLNSIPNAGVTSFAWKESGNAAFKTSTDSFADITAVGSYTVTATSEGGACVKESTAIAITSSLGTIPNTPPTVNTIATVCSGQTITLSTPTVSGVTYVWSGPNSFSSTDQNPTIPNASAVNAGVYSLQLQVSGGTCKTPAATAVADVANLSNFFVSSASASNAFCEGSSLNLIVNTDAKHSAQWIKDGADVTGQTSATLSVTQEGVYKVRVTNIALGCSAETSVVPVTVYTKPVSAFVASAASICVNQNITFTDQSTHDSRATLTYAWDFGDGTNSALQNPTKAYTTAGTRSVQLTVSYSGVAACSNASTKSVVAAVPQTPVVSATINPICKGQPSVLSVSGTFTTYSWTGPVTGATSTLNIDQPGTYVVSTIESNSCTGTAQIVIGEKPPVVLTVTADGNPIASGESLMVVSGVAVKFLASGADTYAWSPSDGLDNASIANPIATPLAETIYTVTGTKAGRCDTEYSIGIKFDPEGNSFLPPNVFSPNGDAINDLWVIQGVQNYSDCTLSVFTKQGSKVLEQKGYANTWDGTYEGKPLPEGTYYYVLSCPDKKPVTGNVLLAR